MDGLRYVIMIIIAMALITISIELGELLIIELTSDVK